MNRKFLAAILGVSGIMMLMMACEKDFKNETPAPRPAPPAVSFVEEFDTVANLPAKGWVIDNKSYPFGTSSWRQGMYELSSGGSAVGFPAYSSKFTPNDFISVDFNTASGLALTSAWLISPLRAMKNGDKIIFYTKTRGSYVDRMQIRANLKNGSTFVGPGPDDAGDFTTQLLDINSGMTLAGYPRNWTKYTLTLSGISGTVNGRFAFRYYVPNSGPQGNYGDMVGVDSVAFVSQ